MQTEATANQSKDDGTLLLEIGHRDVPAFATLVERYQSLVCAIAYAAVCDRALSEDVAQDTFLALWRDPLAIREPAKIRSWLCNTARNRARDVLRKRGRETLTSDLPTIADDSTPLTSLSEHERSAAVHSALAAIPSAFREALVLYYRDGDSVANVASGLGVSVDAVKQRLARGRAKMKQQLEPFLAEQVRRTAPTATLVAIILAAAASHTGVAHASSLAKSSWVLPRLLLPLVAGALTVLGILLLIWKLSADDSARAKQTVTVASISSTESQSSHILASAPASEAEGGRLEGLVLDRDELPVAGAKVTVLGNETYSVQTEQDGSFVFDNLPEADITVMAYDDSDASNVAGLRLTTETEPLVLHLVNGMALVLSVYNSENKPVPNVSVAILGRSTLTDKQGEAVVRGLPPGSARLRLDAQGYGSEMLSIDVPGGTGAFQRRVMLEQGEKVTGKVVDEDDQAVANAQVTFSYGAGLSEGQLETQSDSQGRFYWPGLKATHYSIEATHESLGLAGTSEFTVSATSPRELVVRVSASEEPVAKVTTRWIRGRVVDTQGQPVAGSQVRTLGMGPGRLTEGVSNASGRFALLATEGALGVQARWPGETSTSQYLRVKEGPTPLPAGDDEIVIRLTTPGQIRAQLVTPSGVPEKAWVSISTFAAGLGSFAPSIGAKGGAVELKAIPPGTYVLGFYGPDFEYELREDVQVRSGETLDLGKIELKTGRTISGQVTDARGRGASNTYVVVGRQQVLGNFGDLFQIQGPEGAMKGECRGAYTDVQGRFSIAGVPAEPLSAMAFDATRRSRMVSVAASPAEVELALVVEPGATLRGRITDNNELVRGMVSLNKDSNMVGLTSAQANGQFSFDNVEPGSYTVHVGAENSMLPAATPIGTVELRANETKVFDVEVSNRATPAIAVYVATGAAEIATAVLFQGTLNEESSQEAEHLQFERTLDMGSPKPIEFTAVPAGAYTICVYRIGLGGKKKYNCKPLQVLEEGVPVELRFE